MTFPINIRNTRVAMNQQCTFIHTISDESHIDKIKYRWWKVSNNFIRVSLKTYARVTSKSRRPPYMPSSFRTVTITTYM